jgi:hypothetical protein
MHGERSVLSNPYLGVINQAPTKKGGFKMKKMGKGFSIFIVAAILAAFLAMPGPASAAYSVKQIWARISATAGETLTIGQLVALKDADGYAYKAKADTAAIRPAIGIVGKAATTGQSVEIIMIGIVSGWTSLSEGSPGFLSETAGAITQSAPSYSQQVGVAINTTTYFINCKNYFDTSAITSLGVLTGTTPIIMEGATADNYETTLTVEDPTADRTITLPNYTGGVPLIIAQGNTQTSQAGSGTKDVTGSSLSIAAGWLTAGKTIKYTLSGTKTGTNAAMIVILYLSDAAVMTLTAPGATAVDWQAEFIITEHTDGAHQNIVGRLLTNAAAVVVDYAAATKDVSGAVTMKCQIQSQNAGDTVTNEYVLVEHWVK